MEYVMEYVMEYDISLTAAEDARDVMEYAISRYLIFLSLFK